MGWTVRESNPWPIPVADRSQADRLLGLRIRIPPEAGMLVLLSQGKTQGNQGKETNKD
jgi:hypothetical protein